VVSRYGQHIVTSNHFAEKVPIVTVVIPSFRGGAFLREAIASMQSQTLTNWELIIVLDGCEEDLADVEQADSRIRVLRQSRRGVSIARNVAIGESRAELVALLDDDDRMLPTRLALQCEAMSDVTVSISHTQYRVIDQSGNELRLGTADDCSYLDFLRCESTVLSTTAMFRRDRFQEVGGYNSLLPHSEGQDLFFRIAREGKICFVPDVLYEYRLHDDNVWFGSSSGSEATKLMLRQHYYAARARGEVENLRAVRRGLRAIPSPRVAKTMGRASQARSQHNYLEMFGALVVALFLSPYFTLKAVLRELRGRHSGA
jgi:glycosyltransferase involved in cell wall biosynthesis